ncbi:hypothetical protein BSKO_06792 [Bryopsis sp. KO-2023]|nr:hypothetical protein BSKO_06792 [Bryopsis sp. KO-2023]
MGHIKPPPGCDQSSILFRGQHIHCPVDDSERNPQQSNQAASGIRGFGVGASGYSTEFLTGDSPSMLNSWRIGITTISTNKRLMLDELLGRSQCSNVYFL